MNEIDIKQNAQNYKNQKLMNVRVMYSIRIIVKIKIFIE